jgi:hypothetical protein
MDINDDAFMSHLVSLTENEALNYIANSGLPMSIRANLLTIADKHRRLQRKASRRAKLTTIYHGEAWHRLIAPLKYELSNAKVGLSLKPFDVAPERHKAFSEYITLLEKLLAGLQKMQIDEGRKATVSIFVREQTLEKRDRLAQIEYAKTPTELAVERGLPNKGAHWTDWINQRTKERIRLLFDAIPERPKTKRPNPFSYRIPPDLFKRDIEALQKRTLNELDIANQELDVVKAVIAEQRDVATKEQLEALDKCENTVERIKFALRRTMHMRNEPVPPTWHAFNHLYDAGMEYRMKNPSHRNHTLQDIVADWDEEEDDNFKALRIFLRMREPDAPKQKTNRPKRYRK